MTSNTRELVVEAVAHFHDAGDPIRLGDLRFVIEELNGAGPFEFQGAVLDAWNRKLIFAVTTGIGGTWLLPAGATTAPNWKPVDLRGEL